MALVAASGCDRGDGVRDDLRLPAVEVVAGMVRVALYASLFVSSWSSTARNSRVWLLWSKLVIGLITSVRLSLPRCFHTHTNARKCRGCPFLGWQYPKPESNRLSTIRVISPMFCGRESAAMRSYRSTRRSRR